VVGEAEVNASEEVHERLLKAREHAAELRVQSEELVARAERTVARWNDSETGAHVTSLLEEIRNLRTALESRAVIEQAKGIIVARTGMSPNEAFEVLVRQSQHENRKVRELSELLVQASVRRTGGQGATSNSRIAPSTTPPDPVSGDSSTRHLKA
jgi:hypothetical protein